MNVIIHSNRFARAFVSRLRGAQTPRAFRDLTPAQQRGLLAFAALLALVGAMALGYAATLRPFWVEIDGRTLLLRSHLPTVGDALVEARIWLQPEDRIEPPLDTPLRAGLRVHVQRARTLYITADGDSRVHRTLAESVGEALTEAGVPWIPEDRIIVGGRVMAGDQPLYAATAGLRTASSRAGRPPSLSAAPPPLEVVIQRAVPIGVQDGTVPFTFLTTARTLGEALLEKGIVLYAADRIQPPLETPVQAGLRAFIDRSRPVTILADGRVIETRTRAPTVGQLLQEESLTLGETDYTRPNAGDAVTAGLRVTVVRVSEREVVEEESIPFELEYRGDPNLEIDQQRVDNWGAPGIYKRSLRIRYENGIEVSRGLAREWVEKPPANKVISYGKKIVERQITTADGTFTYWRKLRVLVTAYSPSTAGTPFDAPWFGITRSGMKATKGIIAVDPTVITFMSHIYVPGYGKGLAADTGGMIKGLHIDLCYDDSNLKEWWWWVDIYLLTPVPPASEIRWILPDYPRER